MPSHMPGSFASAAAGQTSSRDSRNGRGDGRGSGDWARRENRSTNGIATFRRPSATPFAQSTPQADPPLQSPTSDLPTAHPLPPSIDQMNDNLRYSKDEMLVILQHMKAVDSVRGSVSHLYSDSWNPEQSSTTNGRGWGRSNDGRDNHGPEVCWNKNADTEPMALQPMTEEEKHLFSTDVNSPMKPPPQNNKDGQTPGANGRKTSVSQGSNTFGLSSPASSRPSTRRQQTTDSISGLQSPSGISRFARDDSPFFMRKANELKDDGDERSDDPRPSTLPFGGLQRANTAGSALGNGPASPWGASTSNAPSMPMGSFGSFSMANPPNPPTPSDKRPTFGRGESRLARLMPMASTEDMSKPADRSTWRSRQRTDTADTDPFAGEAPTGSAALGGGQDSSPTSNPLHRGTSGLDTPVRGSSGEFGMSDVLGFRDSRGQPQQTPQGHHTEHDQGSPSDTNPYRSPPDNRHDGDDMGYEESSMHPDRLGGIPEHSSAFGNMNRTYPMNPYDGSDRSQNSSAGANRGFPPPASGLSTLGALGGGGWPTSNNVGTPDRENRPPFSSNLFGSSLFTGELQSPGGFGSHSGAFGGNPSAGGGRIRSLFPPAMQAQMQAGEIDESENQDMRSNNNAFGTIGGRASYTPSRDTDSPMRAGRHAFDDFPQTTGPELGQGQVSSGFPQAGSAQSNHQPSQESSDSASGTLPAAQMRSMVMPDRMRWVYLDPQGITQGPWSGLEMHDWYKASFFTADLMVKKVEDDKFEPLGAMIRRIGNSREPFLVPQIGIPHGPPATNTGAPFVPASAGPGNASVQPGAVQPPFANSFPSFGTTLTAEQQNNLERRKQEEQFLMARQREFLAQQQVNMKQMQMSGLPSTLHHHSSAHSLQSQPSFGSMTSPIGMPSQPPIPGVPGFFEPPRPMPTQQPSSGVPANFFREDELARLSREDREQLFGTSAPIPQHSQPTPAQQQITSMFGQPAPRQPDPNENMDWPARLQEFSQLRQEEDGHPVQQFSAATLNEPIALPPQSQPLQNDYTFEEPAQIEEEVEEKVKEPEVLSLTQQIQITASSKPSPISAAPESPWGKVSNGLPMPFPPPQSTTPLPAPTAQRNRTNLPEALNVEPRSRSETPEVSGATPSIAPWAKEPAEPSKPSKVLSLREIQDAEARTAAQAEALAAATRRANAQEELKLLQNQAAAPAPGLPMTSTWGNTGSPATPTNAASAWAKPAAKVVPASTVASKKTLADIQREEESRKKKHAAAAAVTQPTVGVTGGKRYADLASKSGMNAAPVGGLAWSTVGPSGKARIPTGPAAVVPPVRAVSSATVATMAAPRVVRPAATVRSVTSGQASLGVAKEEFMRWTKNALTNKLKTGINVDSFVDLLTNLGGDPEVIADSIYNSSDILNGKDFAIEFLRRRNQAEKGIVEPSASNYGAGNSGGWSEVAKKGPPKVEEPNPGFKVVNKKGKGGKKM